MGKLILKKILLFLSKQYTSIGGQAIIEGVMMRSPNAFVVAVRKPDGSIRLRKDQWYGLSKKFSFFKKPFLRGVLTLVESMANGIVSLNYSANVAMKEEMREKALKDGKSEKEFEADQKKKESVNLSTYFTIATSFVFAILLFVFLPHALTAWLGGHFGQGWSLDGIEFHAVDGMIKAMIFILYIFLIGLLPDIRRVFQYHGAEHKSISTFEEGEDLTIENARKFTTLHPRCGTTFIFFLLFISIILFALIFTIIPLTELIPASLLGDTGSRLFHFTLFGKTFAGIEQKKIVTHLLALVFKVMLVFPIAGISFEILKFAGKYRKNIFCKMLSFPGLMLQKLTTKEPDDEQLEVALASLKTVLLLEEKFNLKEATNKVLTLEEVDIEKLENIENTTSSLNDFLE